MEVLSNSTVYYFGISELPLHYKERMLYFAARGGFAVLHLLLPVDPFVGIQMDSKVLSGRSNLSRGSSDP